MAVRPYRVLEFCGGVAGLGLGIRIARPDAHGVVYIEREAHPAEVLAARMEDGSLSPAPIWDDVGTFDPDPWRGVVDCIASGDPCQPNSVAGRGRGAADDRWLIDQLIRVVAGVRPSRVFRENVTGNADGQLEALIPALEGLGYRCAVGIFSAAEVGFNHRRERLFLMADRIGAGCEDAEQRGIAGDPQRRIEAGPAVAELYRASLADAEHAGEGRGTGSALPPGQGMADAEGERGGAGLRQGGSVGHGDGAAGGGGTVGEPASLGRGEGLAEPSVRGGRGSPAGGADDPMGPAGRGGPSSGRVDDGEGTRDTQGERPDDGSSVHRRAGREMGDSDGEREGAVAEGRGPRDSVGEPNREMGNPERGLDGRHEGEPIGRPLGRATVDGASPGVSGSLDDADAGCGRTRDAIRAGRNAAATASLPLAAPGPNDPRWGDVLESAPLRSPAISDVEFAAHSILVEAEGVGRALTAEEAERVVRRVATRMAYRVDRLRDCGNGVSSLAAALAWSTLEATLNAG